MADGLSRKRLAALATLPSESNTSSVTSRLKSGMVSPFVRHGVWRTIMLQTTRLLQ
jgi:hypothetical protein